MLSLTVWMMPLGPAAPCESGGRHPVQHMPANWPEIMEAASALATTTSTISSGNEARILRMGRSLRHLFSVFIAFTAVLVLICPVPEPANGRNPADWPRGHGRSPEAVASSLADTHNLSIVFSSNL